MLKIGFIGGGKMGQALAKGFIAAKLTKGEHLIASCHPDDKLSQKAFQAIGGRSVTKSTPVIEESDLIILSVKPQVFPSIVKEVKQSDITAEKLFISIMMGVPIKKLEKNLPEGRRVIRVMPNTPAVVGEAASVYARGKDATDEDAKTCKSLLNSVGTCDELSEDLIDAVTAVSGSGPAYVYMLIESLAEGGVNLGLARPLALKLAAQTVFGSGKMVLKTGTHPAQLKDDVTSPAGTTAAGVYALEQHGFRAAVCGAVEAAHARALEYSE